MTNENNILTKLDKLLEKRKQEQSDLSYTASLFTDSPDKVLQKIGEETAEVIIASKSGNNKEITHEITDLLFHLMVLLKYHGLAIDDIYKELQQRFGKSGLEEKRQRK